MKEVKKSTGNEPTITDVMASLQDLTEAVQSGFAKHEARFDRHEKILAALHEGQNNLTERVGDMDRRLIATQSRVEDIADMFESTTDVVDESRDQIFDHEIRLKRLEEVAV